MRSQRRASSLSWVMRRSAVPRSARSRNMQLDDDAAGGAVEIAGGLVGQQQPGCGDEGAGDRHALLLAARELRRIMQEPRAEPHFFEPRPRRREGIGAAGKLQGDGDVFQRRHGRHEMEGLEHDADGAAAKARQRVLVKPGEVRACDGDASRGSAARARPAPSSAWSCPTPTVRPARRIHPPRWRARPRAAR